MSRKTEPSFSYAGPLQFETQYRDGSPFRGGPTLKVFIKEADEWLLIMRFDCTRERPHWHEIFKGGKQKIMFWSDTEMDEAVDLTTAEVRSSFVTKLEKLGYIEEASVAWEPSIQKVLREQCDKLYDYISQ